MNHKELSKRLEQLVLMLFEFSEIKRHIYFPDRMENDRKENDVEHSYNLAMCAWYLSQHLPNLNQERVLKMALAHDLVEVHAGDVMAIGRTENEEKQKILREKAALERLKAEWPDFTELTSTITQYEKKDTPEAKFVSALDKILPIYLNMLSDGKTWKHYEMSRKEVIDNKEEKTKQSETVHSIWQELKREMAARDDWFSTLP